MELGHRHPRYLDQCQLRLDLPHPLRQRQSPAVAALGKQVQSRQQGLQLLLPTRLAMLRLLQRVRLRLRRPAAAAAEASTPKAQARALLLVLAPARRRPQLQQQPPLLQLLALPLSQTSPVPIRLPLLVLLMEALLPCTAALST